jgi:hypothetical protein
MEFIKKKDKWKHTTEFLISNIIYKNLIINKLIVVLGFLLIGFLFQCTGQENKLTELEIKTSGNYYFGQGVHTTDDKAREDARLDLVTTIANDLGEAGKFDVNADWLLDGIGYVFFPRGSKRRAVAFILKSDVKPYLEKLELKVNQIHYEDKTNEAPKSDLEPKKKEDDANKINNVKTDDVNSKTVVATDKKTIDSIKTSSPVIKNVKENPLPDSAKAEIDLTTESGILTHLLSLKNIKQFQDILKQLKYKGLLQFGNEQSLVVPENKYILIFNPENGDLTALLDKEKDKKRINLMNKEIVNNYEITYKTKKIIWIQIF